MNIAVCCPDAAELDAAWAARLGAALEHLAEQHLLTRFGSGARPLEEFQPRDYERLLLPIGDHEAFAPLVPILRRAGGTVWLWSWSLRRLARAHRPALARPGLAGRIAAWREGGLPALRGDEAVPLNRSVVRFGDAFIVEDDPTRRRILEERNAPTPTAILRGEHQLGELVTILPAHRTNRRSLIATAVEAADRAREQRRAGRD